MAFSRFHLFPLLTLGDGQEIVCKATRKVFWGPLNLGFEAGTRSLGVEESSGLSLRGGKKKEKRAHKPTETIVRGDALCVMVMGPLYFKGWRLAAVGGWWLVVGDGWLWLVVVGGWHLAVGGGWKRLAVGVGGWWS